MCATFSETLILQTKQAERNLNRSHARGRRGESKGTNSEKPLFLDHTEVPGPLPTSPHTSGACVPVTHTLEAAEAHTAQTWVGTVHMQREEWKELALCKKQAA